MRDISASRIWYREPYVWLVILFPLLAIIGGVITAWLAVRSDDGLVADDYYKRGLEINQVLARDHAARDYGLEAQVTLGPDRKHLRLALRGNERFVNPAMVTATFLHPTRSGHDRLVTLSRRGGFIYEGDLPDLASDRWYLQIEADDWRILRSIHLSSP